MPKRKKIQKSRKKPIYAFIDASNLFYGGQKSLGWKIDYRKLRLYLKNKYKVNQIHYYGGVKTFGFSYSILDKKPIDLKKLLQYLKNKAKQKQTSDTEVILIARNIPKVKFYLKLEKFGYKLKLKPVKIYYDEEGKPTQKANCDVDMTFDMMRYMEQYRGLVALTGDGDFAPVLKYLKDCKREIIILARGERTAKEIRQLAGGNFKDFSRLKNILEFIGNKN